MLKGKEIEKAIKRNVHIRADGKQTKIHTTTMTTRERVERNFMIRLQNRMHRRRSYPNTRKQRKGKTQEAKESERERVIVE